MRRGLMERNMTNYVKISNRQFLEAVFGQQVDQAHVCGFPGDPEDPTAPRSRWAGAWFGEGGEAQLHQTFNNYYVVSTFRKDQHGRAVRTEPHLDALYVLMIDDVGMGPSAKISPRTVAQAFIYRCGKFYSPSFKVETSEGNEQWGYLFKEPFKGHALASLAETKWREFVKQMNNGKDPGSGNLTRYVRLPVGINGKAVNVVNGKPFQCGMLEWNPDRRYPNKLFLEKVLGVTFQEYEDAEAGVHAPGTTGGLGTGVTYTDPNEDPTGWGKALNDRGLLQQAHKPGAWDMECPFIEEHTKQVNTGCAYLGDGLFACHHGHCRERPSSDFQDKLDDLHPGIRGDAARAVFASSAVKADDLEGLDTQTLWKDVGFDPKRDKDQSYLEDRYAYLHHDNEVWDMQNRKTLPKDSFNLLYDGPLREKLAADLTGWTGKGRCPSALESLMRSPTFIRADAKEYAPGEGRWFKDKAKEINGEDFIVMNTWAGPSIGTGQNPTRLGQITPRFRQHVLGLFKSLVEQITGDTGDNQGGMDRRMYNWLSLMVADQKTKPGWQWLIMGPPGFGKDTLASILARLVGDENWTMVGADAISSAYTEWASKRYVIINELSPTTEGRKKGISLFDHMKAYFTAPPHRIMVNPKYGKQYEAHNVGGYMIFSNHPTPLVIDKSERRLAVVDRLKAKNEIADRDGWKEIYDDLVTNPIGLEVVGMWLRERYSVMDQSDLRELLGVAPQTDAKEELRQSGIGKWDELILRWIEDPDNEGSLWTNDQLRDRLRQAAREDRSLGSMTMGQLTSKLREHDAWKPFNHGDKEGRVTKVGTGPRGRDVVWALYEVPEKGLTRDAELPKETIRDMLVEQNAARGGTVVAFPKTSKKDEDEAGSVLDDEGTSDA